MASNQPGPPGPTEGQGATNAEDGGVGSVDNACNTGTGSDNKHGSTGESTNSSTADDHGKGEVDRQDIGCHSDKGIEDETQAGKTDGNGENGVPSKGTGKSKLGAMAKDATKDAYTSDIETRGVKDATAGSRPDKEIDESKMGVDFIPKPGHAKNQSIENIHSDSNENCSDETDKKIDGKLNHNNANKPQMKTALQSEIREGRTTNIETQSAEEVPEPSDTATKGKENNVNLQDNLISVEKPSTSPENLEIVDLNAEKIEGKKEVQQCVTHPGNRDNEVDIKDDTENLVVDKDANKKKTLGHALESKEASKSKALHDQDPVSWKYEDEEKRLSESVSSGDCGKLDNANPGVSTSDQIEIENNKISRDSTGETESENEFKMRTLEDTMPGDRLNKGNEESKDADVVKGQDHTRELSTEWISSKSVDKFGGKLDEKTGRNNIDEGKKTQLDHKNGNKPETPVQSDGRGDQTTENESERTEATPSLKPPDSVPSGKGNSENLKDNLNPMEESSASSEIKEKVENEDPKLTSTNGTEKAEGAEDQVKKEVSAHGDRGHELDNRNDSNDMAAGFSGYETAAKDKDSTEKDAPKDSKKDKVDGKGLKNADLVMGRLQDEVEESGETNNDDQGQGSKELESTNHQVSSAELIKEENGKRRQRTTAENISSTVKHLAEKEKFSITENSQENSVVGINSAGAPVTLDVDIENAGNRKLLERKSSAEFGTPGEILEKSAETIVEVRSDASCTTEKKLSSKIHEQELEGKNISQVSTGNENDKDITDDTKSPNFPVFDQRNNENTNTFDLQMQDSFDTSRHEDVTHVAKKVATKNQNGEELNTKGRRKEDTCVGAEVTLSSGNVAEDERNRKIENLDAANSPIIPEVANGGTTEMESPTLQAIALDGQNLISSNESNNKGGRKNVSEESVDESRMEIMYTGSFQNQMFSATAGSSVPTSSGQQTIPRGYDEGTNRSENIGWDFKKDAPPSLAKYSMIQVDSTGEHEDQESSDEERQNQNERIREVHPDTKHKESKYMMDQQSRSEEGESEILRNLNFSDIPVQVQSSERINEYEEQIDLLLDEIVSNETVDKNREEWKRDSKSKLLNLFNKAIKEITKGASGLDTVCQETGHISKDNDSYSIGTNRGRSTKRQQAQPEPLTDVQETQEPKDTITSSEDYIQLFCEPATLYGPPDDSGKWRILGSGNMLIIKYTKKEQYWLRMHAKLKEDENLKLVCYQQFTSDMKFTKHNNNDRTWTWVGYDVKGKATVFGLKFENFDLALKFLAKVEECKKFLPKCPSAACEDERHSDPNNLILTSWSSEENNRRYTIFLYHGKLHKYTFQITCSIAEYYELMYLFENEMTRDGLMKSFSDLHFELHVSEGEVSIDLGSKFMTERNTISAEIEGVINNIRGICDIQVHCIKFTTEVEKVIDKCKDISPEFRRGNISVYLDEGQVWMVGRKGEELENLIKCLKEGILDEDQTQHLIQSKTSPEDTTPKVRSLTDSKSGSMKDMVKETSKGTEFLATTKPKQQENLLVSTYSNNLMGNSNNSGELSPAMLPKGARSKKGFDYMLIMTFKSRSNRSTMQHYIDYYQYQKWCFLVENDAQFELLCSRMKDINTDLKEPRIDETKGHIEIILECIDEVTDTNALKERGWKCHEIVHNGYEELISIVVKSKDIELVQDFLSKEMLITSKTTEMSKLQNGLGVCLLGDCEAMISIIAKIQTLNACRGTTFFDRETNQEIAVGLIELDHNQSRLWKTLDGENIVNEICPTVKMYVTNKGHAFSLKLIGNKDDVQKEAVIIDKNRWIPESVCKDETPFDKSELDFLCHKVVQKFIDDEIRTKSSGTWIIDNDRSSVSYFGPSDESVKKMVRILHKSFQKERFHIADKSRLSADIEKWKKRTEKIEEETHGKLCMYTIADSDRNTSDLSLEFGFLYTKDLVENPELNSFLTEISLKSKSANAAEDVENLSPEMYQYIMKFKKRDLLETAQAMDVLVDFKEEEKNIKMFLKGNESDISFVRNNMKELRLRQKYVLLPESAVLSNIPEKLCNRNQCVFKKMKQNANSKVWFMHKKVVIVYCGEPRDDLDIDSRAILQFGKTGGKGTTSVSFRKTDKRILTVNLPDMPEGKGMHFAHESFEEAYKQMLTFKGKSLLIPMQNIGNWTVKKFVKGMLYPLINLVTNEVITIVLSDTGPNRCQAANSTLKAANQGSNVKVEILVKKGEIAKEKADVIVNTVAQDLNLSLGAVSGSIYRAAKDGLQEELKGKNSNKNLARYGEMFETDPYGLQCRKIFHGALKAWSDKTNEPRQVMKEFIRKCLEKAHERKFSSIAFPALGTGNLSFHPSIVAEILKEMVEKFEDVHESTSIEKIIFIIYRKDDASFKIFQDALKRENMDENQRPFDIAEEPLQEIMVFGSEADVAQTASELNVCLEAASLKIGKSLKEPDVQEIANRSMTERQEETVNRDNEEKSKGSTNLQEKENNQSDRREELIEADDTKLCVIAKFTDRRKFDENPMLKKMKLQTVVCPYRRENEALLIFKKSEDAEKFLSSNELLREELDLQRMERQAVNNVQAQVSNKFLSIFDNLDDLKENVIKNSGVTIQMSKENKWILHGSLPQIELAHTFLRKSYLSTKEPQNAPKISEPPGNINAPPSGELKTSSNNSKANIGNKSFSGIEGKKDQPEDKDAKQKSVHNKKTTTSSDIGVDRTPESIFLTMSEDEYERFIAVLNPYGETSGGNIQYVDKMLQVSGSKSFIQHIKRQKEEILSEMTVQPIIIPEMDVYDIIKRECKSFSRKNPPVFFLQRDQEKKLEFFGMSQQAVDEAVRSVLDRKEKILEDRKKAVKTSAQGEPKATFMTNEGLIVEVYTGDITKLDVECIVSSTNANLQHKYGIAKVIAEAAGQDFTRACYDYIRVYKALKEGYCCYTKAGKLNYKYVIHANVPYWSTLSDHRAAGLLKQVVFEALVLSETLKVESVGIPAICTGQENANKQKCAEMYAEAVIEYSASALKCRKGPEKRCLQEIHFSDKNQESVKLIAAVFEEKFKNWAMGAGSALKANKNPPEIPKFLPSMKIVGKRTEGHLKLYFKVLIYTGSIVGCDVEAVSCGQDPKLQSKGHIAKDIVGKCKDLKKELANLKKNHNFGLGRTILMNCTLDHAKKVIFVVTESPTGVTDNDYVLKSVKNCYKNVLDFADKNKIKSLAMPLIGTGNKDAPKNKVAGLWFESVLEFLDSIRANSIPNLREVHFVSTDESSTGTIASLLSGHVEYLRQK